MHNNQIWLTFLATVALVLIYYTGFGGYELYKFVKLNGETKPLHIEWTPKKVSAEKYLLEGIYEYNVKGQVYQGQSLVQTPSYRHEEGAFIGIKNTDSSKTTVWYSPNHPEYSILNKEFPMKSTVYMITLWGIFIYLTWLGFYVGKQK